MRLSVLIPTYNCDCRQLVRQLQLQLPPDGELIVGDDCSTDADIRQKNSEIETLPGCHIFWAEHNMGRAAIRNALAREAKGEWLLFIDADAEVRSSSFIANYLSAVTSPEGNVDVVCGGTGNLSECPSPSVRLRYNYEVQAEKRLTLPYRRRFPYDQFTTFNFLIRRSTFLSVCFDEHCREYGYEDVIFGQELKRRGIPIRHIDNKLTHLGLEDTVTYLGKIETALQSLARMKPEQQAQTRVSALAIRIERAHFLWLVSLLFKLSKPLIRANLTGKHPNQNLFAFYKLGTFATFRTAYQRQSGK